MSKVDQLGLMCELRYSIEKCTVEKYYEFDFWSPKFICLCILRLIQFREGKRLVKNEKFPRVLISTGWSKKSLLIDLEENYLRNFKICFEGVFLSILSSQEVRPF